MKKVRAILLFPTLIILIGGYAVWCARPFFVRLALAATIESPFPLDDEDQEIIRHGYAESELITPPEFDWEEMGESLKRPWGEHVTPSVVMVTRHMRDQAGKEKLTPYKPVRSVVPLSGV